MPNATDDFLLTVERALAASITVPDYTTPSGGAFSIAFTYVAGINPAATGIEASFHNSAADRTAGIEISGNGAPTEIQVVTPAGFSATAVTRTGSISGRAPVINTAQKVIYGKATILQAALND